MIASGSIAVTSQRWTIAALAVGGAACGSLAASPADAATLTVSTTKDELVAHHGNCSLREAIEAVDVPSKRTSCGAVSRRSNVIVLRAGRYMLSIPPAGVDDDASGDLTVASAAPLTIAGTGVGATLIDARELGDRVLSVTPGSRLTLIGLTIRGGHPRDVSRAPSAAGGAGCTGADGLAAGGPGNGGGIANGGTLALETVAVTGNSAGGGGAGGAGCGGGDGGQGGSGGGVYNQGRLILIDSTVSGNAAGEGGAGGSGDANPLEVPGPGGGGGAGGSGGGIYSQGWLTVAASAIYDNRAGAGGVGGQGQGSAGIGPRGADGNGGEGAAGGGIFSSGGSLKVTNATLFDNFAGAGGAGGGATGAGGDGGSGGAIAVVAGHSAVRNATVADNGVGAGGAHGSTSGTPGAGGSGGGLFVRSSIPADEMTLQNTIVDDNVGLGCAGGAQFAIVNGGHDLSYGDRTCPGQRGNPKLGPLRDNGGATATMAIGPGSAAIDRVARGGDCPATDQRGVRRPQDGACDIGAYEFAIPSITISAPSQGAFYEGGARILARFRCGEGGVAGAIASCQGSVAQGQAIRTGRFGPVRFVVTAIDKSGNRARRTIGYVVFEYVDPLREVSGLTRRRIDLGVDYAGSGPLLAIGRGLVTLASDTDSGPPSCWAISCWPGGGIVVYRLLDGPFAGRYVYVAEHITVNVTAGQTVNAGQRIAALSPGYPWSEWGWAAGPGPEALAMTDGHRCPCSDPGGWSTIDGRTMNDLLVALGAPSGYLQAGTPDQSMPRGWPSWPG